MWHFQKWFQWIHNGLLENIQSIYDNAKHSLVENVNLFLMQWFLTF